MTGNAGRGAAKRVAGARTGDRKPCRGDALDAYLAALVHGQKSSIATLRAATLAIDDRIGEDVKWNAPSFFIEDRFATFRVHPAKLQVILHTGAKARSNQQVFEIPDPDGLLTWPAKDRCVVAIRDDRLDVVVDIVRDRVRNWQRSDDA